MKHPVTVERDDLVRLLDWVNGLHVVGGGRAIGKTFVLSSVERLEKEIVRQSNERTL